MNAVTNHDDFDFVYHNVMTIPHIFLQNAHKCFDRLRATRRRILSGEVFAAEARGASIFANYQSGKSSIVKIYIRQNIVDYCYEVGLFPKETPRHVVVKLQRKVMYISVSGTSTLMSLLEDVLKAYGDPRYAVRESAGAKKSRILNYIAEFETELLIFDEMNHLRIDSSSSGVRTEATRVHNTLKDFLLNGCPVVFVGTTTAGQKVYSDSHISARCPDRLFIGPLNRKDPKHYKCFKDYCGLIGLELQKFGFFPKRSNFIQKDTLACLFVAAGGFLGHASNIVALAARFATEENAECVEWKHLAAAADDYSIRESLCKKNPFKVKEAQDAAELAVAA
ncbi:TniB family NTP-binding protein [Rhizobium leguminosarum]|uniref:TniB family NTP-binding protein n=1 Tax=Rhizobium leguminosarum TaxID=384 RepID=UPI0004821B58|nr:TniB family NTP-binding protein [Rhizobium leguminosarum]